MTTAAVITARSCAVAGTVLTGLPVAAPIALALLSAAGGHGLRFDYLMPGELFMLAAPGGILLIIAAIVARRFLFVATSLTALMIGMFCATAWLAAATGLASGRTAAVGSPLGLVMGAYGGYVLALMALCVWGVFVCRDLFGRRFPAPPDAARDATTRGPARGMRGRPT